MSSAEEKMLDPPPAAQPSGSRFESYVLIDWSRPAELSGVLVLAVLLCYASGLPLLLVSVLQQMGQLPSLSCTGFWTALFPVSAGQFKEDSLKGIDLLAPNYLILALPWFVLSILWEGLMLRFIVRHRPRHLPRLNDTLISLSLGVLNQAVTAVVFLGWVGPLYSWLHRHIAIVQLDANSKAAWWGSLVMYDLCYYWWHRWSHHFSWLWTDHVVHHSSEEYNLATALRQPFNAFATPDTLISVMPLALFFPWQLASMHVSLSLLYQFWIHTSLVPPTPWFELLFNSPSLHRIHHIRNPELLGKNYGAILSVWDRMFGTLAQETDDWDGPPTYYGVVPPLHSWNPLWANLQHWHYMFTVQAKWHGWCSPFRHWTPPGGKCPPIGRKMNPVNKYDAMPRGQLRPWLHYAILQFVCSLALVTVATLELETVSRGTKELLRLEQQYVATALTGAVLFACILWTVCAVADSLEVRPDTARGLVKMEGLRHLVLAGLAAAFVIKFERSCWQAWLVLGGYLCVQVAGWPARLDRMEQTGALCWMWLTQPDVLSEELSAIPSQAWSPAWYQHRPDKQPADQV